MALAETVLFDLDGTLVDTAPDFIYVVNRLLEEEGKAPLAEQSIRNTVSNGARALVNLAFGITEEDAKFQHYRQRLLDLYSEHLAVQSQLFKGMDHLLTTLENKSMPWGIVTNKPSQYAEPLITTLGLSERCAVMICPDHVKNRKPHPEALLTACQRINARPDKTVYVGDHLRDIEAGKNALMKTIVALFGYIAPSEDPLSWGADYAATNPAELADIILKPYP